MTDTDGGQYERLDLDRHCDKHEALLGSVNPDAAGPASKSWLRLNVELPSRLAATSITCILIYEVLVGVSMGVRRMRFIMVNWLMYVLLVVNGLLLLCLALIVVRSRKDLVVHTSKLFGGRKRSNRVLEVGGEDV